VAIFLKKEKEKERKRKENQTKPSYMSQGLFVFCRQGYEISRKQREELLELLESRQKPCTNSNAHTRSSNVPSIRLLKLERSS
jgi:hypothetical protein